MPFKPYDPGQTDLFGWRPGDCLSEADPAYVVAEVVSQLELGDFAWQGEGAGQPPYAPQLMLSVLLYGMIRGVFSSRALASSCRRDMGFIYLAGGARPDFKTICNFRNTHGAAIRAQLSGVIAVLRESGVSVAGRLVLDSTRLRANASRDGMIRADSYESALASIDRYLLRSAERDGADDASYGEEDAEDLPPGLRSRPERARALKSAIERARAAGRKAVSPVDPQCEQMRESGSGKIIPGYGLQVGVDKGSGVITVCEAAAEPTDSGFTAEAVRRHEAAVGACPVSLDADSGYYNGEVLASLEESGIDTCVPDGCAAARVRFSQLFGVDDFKPVSGADAWRCPAGEVLEREGSHSSHGRRVSTYRAPSAACRSCRLSGRCLRKSDRGRRRLEVWPAHTHKRANRKRFEDPEHAARYRRRGSYIERIFGHLKRNLGFRQWLHCGLEKVRTTAALIGMAHNIMVLARVKAVGC